MTHDPNNIKIILADDHQILRKSLRNMIEGFENIVVMADVSNGKELLDLLHQLDSQVLPDIIILDIHMPQMDGYIAAQQIHKKWPMIKILALSMYGNEESIIKMLRCGAVGYVLKDISPWELREAILHLKSNSFYYSDQVTGRVIHMAKRAVRDEDIITEREYEFLQHCCTDRTYREIAQKMYVSPRTVEGYRENLFRKLQVNSRIGLAMYAVKTGIVQI